MGPARTLWEAKAIAEGAEKYYFFSDFVASLNEVEAGVAPTDTRLRPDQREGEGQNANMTEKGILKVVVIPYISMKLSPTFFGYLYISFKL